MIDVTLYETAPDELIRYAVIVARSHGKWVLCRHKERNTLELPGGHREPGETPLDTAHRELQEETGALNYTLTPMGFYKITDYGALYFADIRDFDPILHSEIAEIFLLEDLPKNWTYPRFHPRFAEEALRRGLV